jgi:hypothetical protein
VHFNFETANNTPEQLSDALALANKYKINIAFSCPCFEIWFLLHFEYSTKAYIDAKQLIKSLKKHIPDYQKNDVPHSNLFINLEQAKMNAEKLRKHNQLSNSDNPSTNVDILLAEIEELKKNKPV